MEIKGLYKTFEENKQAERIEIEKNIKNEKKIKNIRIENAVAKSISRILHMITDIIAYILASLGLFCLINPSTKQTTISALKEIYTQLINIF